MMIDGGHQVPNLFKRVCMGVGFSAVDAMRRRDRIKIQQASTNSGTECAAEEVLGPVIGGLRTNGVAIVFDQPIKDSVNVGGSHLSKLHVGNEVFDEVVIALVALHGAVAQLAATFTADASGQIAFKVGLHGIGGLALPLSDVDLRQFQIRQSLHVSGRLFRIIIANLSQLLVRVYAPLHALFHNPLTYFQNPPPPVPSNMSVLHGWLLYPRVPHAGYRMG